MMIGVWFGLLACAFTPPNGDDIGGPLRLRNEFPFQLIFHSTPPLDARIPARPRWDLRLIGVNSIAYPNRTARTAAGQAAKVAELAGRPIPLDFASVAAEAAANPANTYYLADTETYKLEVLYTRPFGRRWALEIEAPLYAHSAGAMDDLVEVWHKLFGMPDVGRNRFPYDLSQVGLARGGQSTYFFGQAGPGLGDVTVRGLYNLTPQSGWWPALAVSAAVDVPLGDVTDLFGNGTWEGGVGLHLTRQFGQSWLYGTVGYNVHDGWRGMSGVPVRNSLDIHGGYEFRVSPNWSVVGGVSLYGSSLETNEAKSLKNAASLYGLAARYNDGEKVEFEWGFSENIVRNNNSLDYGMYGRLRFWR